MKKQLALIFMLALTFAKLNSQTLTSPNGGENWTVGSIHQITYTGSAGQVIKYSINNGASWINITYSGTSPYNWTIPNTPSSQCRVKISWCGSCVDSSNAVFTISSGSSSIVSEKTAEQNRLKIYPNPCSSDLKVELNNWAFENQEIEIYNLLGDVMLSRATKSSLESISVTELPSGIYFLRLVVNNKKMIVKFVKE